MRPRRAAHEREVRRWLLAAQRLGVHTRVGYASLAELAERVLGLNARKTEERLRVGRALGDLRLPDGALAAGELSWSAVRELTRVATRETEPAWLDWAKGRRVRQIDEVVVEMALCDGQLLEPGAGALEKMGFKPTQARSRVDAALHTGMHGDLATLLHAALRAT